MAATERVVGRNVTDITAGPDGLVFTKQLVGERDDAERRYRNCLRWDRGQREAGLAISPQLVDHAFDPLVLSYPYVQDATSLQSHIDADGARGEVPSDALADLLGTAAELLAQVHTVDVELDRSVPDGDASVGPLRKFLFLTPDEFADSSGAELECWRLFHHDEPLQEALEAWLDDLRGDDAVPVHGDLRPDQFLVTPEGMFIIDWEEFGMGPPSRDVAGLAGAIVFDALYRTFTKVGADGADTITAHRELVARGARRLESVAQTLRGLLDDYEGSSGRTLDRDRLAADIGWYLVERVLARAMLSQKLASFDKAIAGIGRQVLLRPDLLARLL